MARPKKDRTHEQYTDWDKLPLLLTVDQTANLLQMHANTVKRLAGAARLPGVKVGREWRFKKSDLMAYVDAGGTGEGEA